MAEPNAERKKEEARRRHAFAPVFKEGNFTGPRKKTKTMGDYGKTPHAAA